MKKLKNIFAFIYILFIGACAANEELDDIRKRVDQLEGMEIATINDQLVAITNSIGDLNKTDGELKSYIVKLQESKKTLENNISDVQKQIELLHTTLKTEVSSAKLETLEALEKLKTDLETQLVQQSVLIKTLQEKDTALENRIKTLEAYVADDLNKTQEWANATFSTLEQYNETVETIAGIKVEIEKINSSLDVLEKSLYDKIDQSIASSVNTLRSELKEESEKLSSSIMTLDANLKEWVNNQLTNYYTIAELDAKFQLLQSQYKDADDELTSEIKKTQEEVAEQKKNITAAYQKAISDAIETNNGILTAVIYNEIKSVNDKINSVAAEINAKLEGLELRVAGLEKSVAGILSQIQSIVVIPTNSDGSVSIGKESCNIHFEILPLEAAQKLVNVDLSAFSLRFVSTIMTKSAVEGGELSVSSVSYEDSEFVVETSGIILPDSFFQGMEGVSCRLKISDGVNNVSSTYFSLSPYDTSGEFFKLQDLSGNQFKPFLVENNNLHVFVPHSSNLSALYPKFTGDDIFMSSFGYEITGKQAFDFSDFVKPFTFKQISKSGDETKWTVIVYDIPVFMMNTPNNQPIVSKTERVKGTDIKIIDGEKVISLGTAGVRGRGNATWDQPKKPYNVKLDKKQEVLGMSKSKNWILLSNPYYDRTQIHNATAFEIARITDFPWVPEGHFVELILNNEHKGLYYLTEKIDVDQNKINIDEIKTSKWTGPGLTGGYLLEQNNAPNVVEFSFATPFYNTTGYDGAWQLGWEVKSPEDPSDALLNLVKEDLSYVEGLIANEETLLNGMYRDYLDIETTIDWWLVETLCANEESSRTKNAFLYKKNQEDKVHMGPPWDFDAWAFGTGGVQIVGFLGYSYFFKDLYKDPVFAKRMQEKWNAYKSEWRIRIPAYIDSLYEQLNRSAKRNEAMWPDWWGGWNYPIKSYETCIEEMKSAFITQYEYMDVMMNEKLGDWVPGASLKN